MTVIEHTPDATPDDAEVHRRVLARLRNMTEAEGKRSLIDAGILDESGKLADFLTKKSMLSYRDALDDDA